MRPLILSIIILFFQSNAIAYPSQKTFGIGSGHTWTQAVFNDGNRVLGSTQEAPSYTSVENKQIPWRVFYASRFLEHYGFEFGFVNFGGIQFNKTLTTTDTSTNNIISTSKRKANIQSQGYYLQHILEYPATDFMLVNLKAGIIIGDTQYSEIETLTVNSEDTGTSTLLQVNRSRENLIDLFLSTGMHYFINESLSLSLQLDRINVNHNAEKESFTQWFTSTSIQYHF